MNGFDADVMKSVLKEVVFIGKAISSIKSEIIDHNPERIIRKANAPFVGDAVIFAINVKLMKVVFAPALYVMENEVKRGQRCTRSDS